MKKDMSIFAIIIVVTGALILLSIYLSGGKQVSSQGLVSITFRANVTGVENVRVIFPVFRDEQRMPPVPMEKKGEFFETTVKLPKNGLIRYEYEILGQSYAGFERISEEFPVWRMVHVTGPLTLTDDVYLWPQETERSITVHGSITDKDTGSPVLDAVVMADGVVVWEKGDGSYEISLRPGRHQFIVYTLDGRYKTQSQFINVSGDTELDFVMERANPVKVRINIDAELPPYHKLRIYSNSEQTGHRRLAGNWFETSTFLEVDGNSVELDLYENQYFEYVYTIGNLNFGNEQGDETTHRIRYFVAKDGLVVNDIVGRLGNDGDIQLNVITPEFTDYWDWIGVYVDGADAIYMHRKENNEWTLKVFPKIYLSMNAWYTYYRNAQPIIQEAPTNRKIISREMNDVIEAWQFQSSALPQQSFSVPEIEHKFDIFPFLPDLYAPDIDQLLEPQITRAAEKGFPGVVLSQIWGFPNFPKYPTLTRALYASLANLERVTSHAKGEGLKVALYPQLVGHYMAIDDIDVPIESGDPSDEWLENHVDDLERFNLYNAHTAQTTGIDYLLVQPSIAPMSDTYRKRYNERMKEIIAKMRDLYTGKILAEIEGEEVDHPVDYWRDADIVSARVQEVYDFIDFDTSQEEADRLMAEYLDDKYEWAHQLSGKPFIMQQFTVGPLEGFIDNPTVEQAEAHWDRQKKIHEAIFKAANERDWISGIWLFAYNFSDMPEKIDANIRGKPAEELAATWARSISET